MTAQPKPTAADVEAALGFMFGESFDGWLAEHDAQVAAQALRAVAGDLNCLDDCELVVERADRIAGASA